MVQIIIQMIYKNNITQHKNCKNTCNITKNMLKQVQWGFLMKKICVLIICLSITSLLLSACGSTQPATIVKAKRRFQQYVEPPKTQQKGIIDLSEGDFWCLTRVSVLAKVTACSYFFILAYTSRIPSRIISALDFPVALQQ